jgi:TP901 family phage tail tape measure protein
MADSNTLETKFTADVTDALRGIKEFKEALEAVGKKASEVVQNFLKLDSGVEQSARTFDKYSQIIQQFQAFVSNLGKTLDVVRLKMTNSQTAMADIAKATGKATTALSEYDKAWEALSADFGNQPAIFGRIIQELNKLENEYKTLSLGKGLEKTLTWQYEAQTLIDKSLQNWIAHTKTLTAQQKNLIEANAQLNTGLTDASFAQTTLGKAILSTYNNGQLFYNALVKGGMAVGINTEKTAEYVSALKEVYTHLKSVSSNSINYNSAVKELKNSEDLHVRTMQLMNGEITKVSNGFLATKSSVAETGTVMTSYRYNLDQVAQSNKSLVPIYENLAAKYKNQPLLLSAATNSLLKYGESQEGLRTTQRSLLENLVETSNGMVNYGGKLLQGQELTRKLNYEKSRLTGLLNQEGTVLKFLASGYDNTEQGLMQFINSSMQGTVTYKEFQKELTGFNTTVRQLGEYNEVYANSFKKSASSVLENKGQVEAASQAYLKYARTAEQIIYQMNEYVRVGKQKAAQDYEESKNIGNYVRRVSELESQQRLLTETLRNQGTASSFTAHANSINTTNLLEYAKASGVSSATSLNLSNVLNGLTTKYSALSPFVDKLRVSVLSGNMEFERAQTVLAGIVKSHESYLDTLKTTESWSSKVLNKIKEYVTYYAAAAAIFAATVALREGVVAIANYDQALYDLQAILGSTRGEAKTLGETMKDASSKTIYSLNEIGDGVKLMGQAGLSTQQIIQSLTPTLDLAMGTLEKMEPVVDLLTSTMVSFGKEAFQVSEIADVMAMAINRSKLDVEKLRTIFNYIGVSAKQAGLSLQETAASAMILADSGLKASTIGTGLRNVVSKLIAPNIQLRQTLQAIGQTTSDLNPLVVGYEKALENLSKILSVTSVTMDGSIQTTMDASKAYEMFGLRGAQAALALTSAFLSGKYQETVASLDETGVAAKMARTQMEGLEARFKNLVANTKLLAVALGESGLVGSLKIIVSSFNGLVETINAFLYVWNNTFVGQILQGIVMIIAPIKLLVSFVETSFGIKMTASFLSFLKSFNSAGGVITGVVSKIGTSLTALQTSIVAAFANHPIASFIAVLMTLSGFILMAEGYMKKFVDEAIDLGESFISNKNTIEAFIGGLKQISLHSNEQKEVIEKLRGKYTDFETELLRTTGKSDLAEISFKDLSSALSDLNEKFGETEAYQVYVSTIQEAVRNTKAYQNAFNELKKEFPDLYEKLIKMISPMDEFGTETDETADSINNVKKAIDISKLSLEELNIIFKTMQVDQFKKSMDDLGKVLSLETGGLLDTLIDALKRTGDIMMDSSEQTSVAKISTEQYDRAIKAARETLIQYAMTHENFTDEQIDNELRRRNFTEQAINDIKKGLREESEFRKTMAKSHEDITKKMKTNIEGLTIFEKMEFQKTMRQYDEEATSFKKLVDDKQITEEDYRAVMIALEQKYHLKAQQLISDASKKENETEDQKYQRERSLLANQINYILSENESLAQNILKLKEQNKGNLDKQIAAQTMALESGLKKEQELREKYAANELEQYSKSAARMLSTLKTNASLFTSVITKREEEKLQIQIDTAEQEYKVVQSSLEKIRALYGSHDLRVIDAMNKEVEARKAVLDAQYKLIEYYLSKYEEAYAKRQDSIQLFYEREKQLVQISYENYVRDLDIRLQDSKDWLENTFRDQEEIDRRKFYLEKTYNEELLREAEYTTNQLVELAEKETEETVTAIKEKYQLREQFMNQEALLAGSETDKFIQSEWKITDETKESLQERHASYVEYNGKIYVLEQQAVEQSKDINNQRTELEKKIDSEILEARRKGLEQIKKIYEDEKSSLVSRYNAEKSQLDSLIAKRKSLNEKLRDLDRSYQSDLFDLQTQNMSEYEKYSATVKRINELMNEARSTGDTEYLNEAKSLTKSLAKEVVDENGFVVKSAEEMTSIKTNLLTSEYNLQKELIERQKKDNEDQISSIKNSLDSLKSKIDEYDAKIVEVSNKELKLKKDDVEKSINEVKSSLGELDNLITKARKLEIDMGNFQEVLDKAKQAFAELNESYEKNKNMSFTVSFKDTNDTELSKSIDKVKEKVDDLKKSIEESKVKLNISISLNEDEKAPLQGLTDIYEKIKGIEEKNNVTSAINIQVKGTSNEQDAEISSLLTFILEQVDKFVDKAVTYTINVIGLEDLKAAVDYQESLHDTTTTHTIITHYESDGSESDREGGLVGLKKFATGGFTGALSGFGGGDIIPAMLEPGEFVLRKESVQRYGLKFFKMLNEMKLPSMFMPKFSAGGPVSTSVNESPMQVIEFRVDSSSHTLYGDSNTIRNLTNSLRRAKLVTV